MRIRRSETYWPYVAATRDTRNADIGRFANSPIKNPGPTWRQPGDLPSPSRGHLGVCGRSSDSCIILLARPSRKVSSIRPTFQWHLRAFVRTHSGGSVPESHRLPSQGPSMRHYAVGGPCSCNRNRIPVSQFSDRSSTGRNACQRAGCAPSASRFHATRGIRMVPNRAAPGMGDQLQRGW